MKIRRLIRPDKGQSEKHLLSSMKWRRTLSVCVFFGSIFLHFSFTIVLAPISSSLIPGNSIGEIETEYKSLDPNQITHVYHIGHIRPYGRSNNQIVSILHAIDIALDNNGDLPNNHAVVAISNWAFEILKGIFYNGSNSTEFSLHLEQLRPALLVHEDRLEALGLTESQNKTQSYLSTKDAYYYTERYRHQFTPQLIKKRRQAVLGTLFQYGVAERNLVLHNAVLDYIKRKRRLYGSDESEEIKYVTIHSRWLEGECEERIGSLLPKDECWMTPHYIKDIMGGTIDRPIVLIGDGQNQEVIQKLRHDADIGPALIVPEDIIPDDVEVFWWTQPWSDMMIAIMGDAFVGTRASTFAKVIGMFRVVKGADPASNFIYTSRGNSSDKERAAIEVCEDCLFLCSGDERNLCGDVPVYT
eukprot:CAMPEP_0197187784 /NCGR_PEP_ID=MMETSP1423-20130617/16563_1 /TAXON_ID=476441 /ORGANISM="Pseudo-nitzschia heimii, Strain UNC1101" /LENGTH=413 /DNA_ID=CAMNT_0042639447 /DNA_START=30 /DNA_END=1271 /DNA_ORIENTATION=+